MKNNILSIGIVIMMIFAGNPVFSQNDDNDDGDSGNTDNGGAPSSRLVMAVPGLGLRVNYKNKFQLYQDSRAYINTADGIAKYEELSVGAKFYLGKIDNFHFTTTASYLHTLDGNFQTTQYRPKAYFTTNYHKNNLRVEFRNRFEYIIKTGQNSGTTFRYRPRIKLGLILRKGNFRFYPYIYDELIRGQNGFDQNRVKLAISTRYKNINLSIGDLVKIKQNGGYTENRITVDLSYQIKIKKTKTTLPKELGVDPLYR